MYTLKTIEKIFEDHNNRFLELSFIKAQSQLDEDTGGSISVDTLIKLNMVSRHCRIGPETGLLNDYYVLRLSDKELLQKHCARSMNSIRNQVRKALKRVCFIENLMQFGIIEDPEEATRQAKAMEKIKEDAAKSITDLYLSAMEGGDRI